MTLKMKLDQQIEKIKEFQHLHKEMSLDKAAEVWIRLNAAEFARSVEHA